MFVPPVEPKNFFGYYYLNQGLWPLLTKNSEHSEPIKPAEPVIKIYSRMIIKNKRIKQLLIVEFIDTLYWKIMLDAKFYKKSAKQRISFI